MDTSKFKDWKEVILERPDIVAEREWMERSREQLMQSDRYQEYLARKQARQDIKAGTGTSRRTAESVSTDN